MEEGEESAKERKREKWVEETVKEVRRRERVREKETTGYGRYPTNVDQLLSKTSKAFPQIQA